MKSTQTKALVDQAAKKVRKAPAWAKLTAVFLVLEMLVAVSSFPAINIYYNLTFDETLADQSVVTLHFDENPGYPGSDLQTTDVTGNSALIRLDPENSDSTTLTIEVSDPDAQLSSLSEQVSVGGHLWYTVAEISSSSMSTSESEGGAPIYSLSEKQINQLHSEAKQKSELKFTLLLLFALIYVISLLRTTILRKISGPVFAVGLAGTTLLGFFIYHVYCKPPLSVSGYPYRQVIIAIMLACFALLAINILVGAYGNKKVSKVLCAVNYLIAVAYAVFQRSIYTTYFPVFPDEQAHLSYIAFLKNQGGIFPDFANMGIYASSDGIMMFSDRIEFNYLGHPPLYYKIMSLIGDIHLIDGGAILNVAQLRMLSFCLGMIGLLIIFYLGYTRLAKTPILHLLFAAIVIAPPNVIYGMSGVTNDTLALVTVSVFIWGIIRFKEEKYSLTTFLLIAFGISGTLLTKATAGLLVALTGIGVVLYTLIAEKNRSAILRREFLITLPIYVIAVAYYVVTYATYHTLQPSYQQLAWSEYVASSHYVPITNRQIMSVLDYISYYADHFIGSWYTITAHAEVPRDENTWLSISCIGIIAILFIPMLVFFVKKNKSGWYLAIGMASTLVVMFYQAYLAFWGFYENGYPGGFQSRYYLCAISLFALTILWLISCSPLLERRTSSKDINKIELKQTVSLTQVGTLICSIAVVLLVYNGFISSFLYWADTLSTFAG